MGVFYHETELCELFKSKNKGFNIRFNIDSKKVSIFVHHFGNWTDKRERIFYASSGKTLSYQSLVGKKLPTIKLKKSRQYRRRLYI